MKKYWHELTDEEFSKIDPETLCSKLRKKYKQPDWCDYPDAIGALGCWSLVGSNRIKISIDFCKTCVCFNDSSLWK